MSTSVWPPIAPDELRKKEDESLANELSWLLDSLQESLSNLKSGLEDCYALLAPIEPGSNLVISSVRSEAVKGIITRVGTQIVKGSLNLRLKSRAPLSLTLSSNPILLQPLKHVRTLLNNALDCVDITRWTGDRHSATFISSQLLLLHQILVEARAALKGPPLLDPNTPNSSDPARATWPREIVDGSCFSPELRGVAHEEVAVNIEVVEASLVVTVRVLEDMSKDVGFGTKLAFAIGAQRRLEHDEMDGTYIIPATTESGTGTSSQAPTSGTRVGSEAKERKVRVKEKVRVESADPSLMSAMAKIAALEHNVGMARMCLSTVMGQEMEEL